MAVKVIRIDALISEEDCQFLRERLIREARAAGRLTHPGIVAICHIGEDAGQTYIVMERVAAVSAAGTAARWEFCAPKSRPWPAGWWFIMARQGARHGPGGPPYKLISV